MALTDIRPAEHAVPVDDIVDIWGYDSFPASDPPPNW
ncbi:hypothetical protein Noca_2760 [Nocardioides sp. JS614]|nr:hypothetical protein Noca_2760 [Nocardioides sp. JS614]